MNDTQKDKMLAALGRAFDKAATSCSHERQAALQIVAALSSAGFKIVPTKKEATYGTMDATNR
jgi:hypothetical protein